MKKPLILLFTLIISINIFASGSNNPDDIIYTYFDRWRNLGLIERLPPIRPYSSQYIISVLNKVKEKGSKADAKIASDFLDQYSSTSLDFIIKHNNYSDLSAISETQFIDGVGIDTNLNLNSYVYGGLDINLWFLNSVSKKVTPFNLNTGISVNDDWASIDFFDVELAVLQGLDMNMSFGTESMWFQTGIMQASFGPLFSNSVVLNSQANQAPHFSYTWIHDYFTASYLFMPIVATNNEGGNLQDGKYIHIKSLDFQFTKWWEFQFYETVVYGGEGIKPEYFLPFSEFFYTGGLSMARGLNSLMGVSSRFQFPQNISLTGTVYADDIHFNELAKLNFNAKMKLAAQGELNWTPRDSFLQSISLGYTAVMPYMYTHQSYEGGTWSGQTKPDINYENYTNGGVTMGAYNMEPNSDKLELTAGFKLPMDFLITYHTEFNRHGNASEGTDSDTKLLTDGSIFDTGFSNSGSYLYQLSNPFLTQDVLDKVYINQLTVKTPGYQLLKGEITGSTILTHELNSGISSIFWALNLNYNF